MIKAPKQYNRESLLKLYDEGLKVIIKVHITISSFLSHTYPIFRVTKIFSLNLLHR